MDASLNYRKSPRNLKRALMVYQYINLNPGTLASEIEHKLELPRNIIYEILGSNFFRQPQFFLAEDDRGCLYPFHGMQ